MGLLDEINKVKAQLRSGITTFSQMSQAEKVRAIIDGRMDMPVPVDEERPGSTPLVAQRIQEMPALPKPAMSAGVMLAIGVVIYLVLRKK